MSIAVKRAKAPQITNPRWRALKGPPQAPLSMFVLLEVKGQCGRFSIPEVLHFTAVSWTGRLTAISVPLLLLLVALPRPSFSDDFSGSVVGIPDGDTASFCT